MNSDIMINHGLDNLGPIHGLVLYLKQDIGYNAAKLFHTQYNFAPHILFKNNKIPIPGQKAREKKAERTHRFNISLIPCFKICTVPVQFNNPLNYVLNQVKQKCLSLC